jgi:fucose permease
LSPTAAPHSAESQSVGALRALVVSGLLLALPGGLLPLWAFHIQTDFARAGDYFIATGAGLAAGALLTQKWGGRIQTSRLLAYSCFVAAAAIILLAFAAPPADFAVGFMALLIAAAAAGALNAGMLRLIGPAWQSNPAGITLTGGIYFAAGSALASVLLAWCFEATNAPRFVAILAIVPAIAGSSMLLRRVWASPGVPDGSQAAPQRTQNVSVLAILFALLLFFQFANEFSIAGWLPVFLIDRLGISPHSAVDLLALYWLALAAGRLGAARLLPRIRHGILLAGSAFFALFGCAAMLGASTAFGTVVGILLAGIGFSTVYPLASEKISTRISAYHPGYFNAIFTFALPGAMLVPFALGHAAAEFGLRVAPIAAMIGSCAVILLLLIIWLGRIVSGD